MWSEEAHITSLFMCLRELRHSMNRAYSDDESATQMNRSLTRHKTAAGPPSAHEATGCLAHDQQGNSNHLERAGRAGLKLILAAGIGTE